MTIVFKCIACFLVAVTCSFGPRGFVQACDSASGSCQQTVPITCCRQGAWFVANSSNFQVCSLANAEEAEKVARRSEVLRAEMSEAWQATDAACQISWSPRCQIILHSTAHSYLCAVGKQLATTRGSSLVTPAHGKITNRRIDLRSDANDVLNAALPHELCHVVLADRFRSGPPPLWFEEGVALLADPAAKQNLHERDLRLAMKRSRAFRLQSLLVMKEYPAAENWDVFYGQSASLVRLLLQEGSSAQLIRFVENLELLGPNAAVREVYGFSGCAELEQFWRSAVSSSDKPTMRHLAEKP